jgi:hypothetical protein
MYWTSTIQGPSFHNTGHKVQMDYENRQHAFVHDAQATSHKPATTTLCLKKGTKLYGQNI